MRRSPLKRKTPLKAKGGRRFPNREDSAYLAWLRGLPCAVCEASNEVQTDPTEVEHWVTKARGGYDRGDTFPTCARHRVARHNIGDQAFQRRFPQRIWGKAGREYALLYFKIEDTTRCDICGGQNCGEGHALPF